MLGRVLLMAIPEESVCVFLGREGTYESVQVFAEGFAVLYQRLDVGRHHSPLASIVFPPLDPRYALRDHGRGRVCGCWRSMG